MRPERCACHHAQFTHFVTLAVYLTTFHEPDIHPDLSLCIFVWAGIKSAHTSGVSYFSSGSLMIQAYIHRGKDLAGSESQLGFGFWFDPSICTIFCPTSSRPDRATCNNILTHILSHCESWFLCSWCSIKAQLKSHTRTHLTTSKTSADSVGPTISTALQQSDMCWAVYFWNHIMTSHIQPLMSILCEPTYDDQQIACHQYNPKNMAALNESGNV